MGFFFVVTGVCALLVILVITPWLLWRLLRAVVLALCWAVSNFMAGWREAAGRDDPPRT